MNVLIVLLFSLWAAQKTQAEPIKTPQQVYSSISPIIHGHTGDYPLPTDMTFKAYADHTIDAGAEYFDPDIVQQGDTIYLADWYISWFVKYIHPKIEHPYILISNDSDGSHPDFGSFDYHENNGAPPDVQAVRTLLYDPKVAVWFCKNMLLSRHPKIVQIPIGQNIIYWGTCPELLFSLIQGEGFNKTTLLYMNIQIGTHPSRRPIAEFFQDKPYCFSRINKLQQAVVPKAQFYEELSQSVFTIAPPGYGPDTVRFWEAIVLDSIPIAKHSELDDLYADLPVLLVDEWEGVNEALLHKKRQEIANKKVGKEKAYFDYWARKIDAYQAQVRNGSNLFSSLEATRFKSETLKTLAQLFKDKTSSKDKLFCKGAAMGLRPFELADRCPSLAEIYVQDPWGSWGHEQAGTHLKSFVDGDLQARYPKMHPINFYDHPYSRFPQEKKVKTHVFLDLSYLRCRLTEDLNAIYPQASSKTLICGNGGQDEEVKRMLDKFSKSSRAQIKFQGDIWFFVK